MHYKTIILELINDQPDLALQLRGKKQMLATIETAQIKSQTRRNNTMSFGSVIFRIPKQ